MNYKIDKNLITVISDYLCVDLEKLGIEIDDFIYGMLVELEHGTIHAITNVTNDDPITTYKIALAHLLENKDYYKALAMMEDFLKNDKLDELLEFYKETIINEKNF